MSETKDKYIIMQVNEQKHIAIVHSKTVNIIKAQRVVKDLQSKGIRAYYITQQVKRG